MCISSHHLLQLHYSHHHNHHHITLKIARIILSQSFLWSSRSPTCNKSWCGGSVDQVSIDCEKLRSQVNVIMVSFRSRAKKGTYCSLFFRSKFQFELEYFWYSPKQVGFFIIGSGIGKVLDSGSGSGHIGVLNYTIRYFRVCFLLSGISGYSSVFPVNSVILDMSHLLLLGKFECGGGPIFKVVLEC